MCYCTNVYFSYNFYQINNFYKVLGIQLNYYYYILKYTHIVIRMFEMSTVIYGRANHFEAVT